MARATDKTTTITALSRNWALVGHITLDISVWTSLKYFTALLIM